MDHRTPLYIDLKRSLDYPRGSLSPHQPSTTVNHSQRRSPQPLPPSRQQQRQDAESFTHHATLLFLAFLVLTLAIYAHRHALLPLLGF